jgi:hypothetical protein
VHRHNGKRFIVSADEKPTAFLELESAIQAGGELPRQSQRDFSELPGYKTKHPQALITLALVCFALALHITCH